MDILKIENQKITHKLKKYSVKQVADKADSFQFQGIMAKCPKLTITFVQFITQQQKWASGIVVVLSSSGPIKKTNGENQYGSN